MRHKIANAEPIGAEHLHHKRVNRFFPKHRIGAGEIDEIRIVRQRMGDAVLLESGFEQPSILVRKLLGAPLVVVLGEDLHAVAANRAARSTAL